MNDLQDCQLCSRLVAFRSEHQISYPGYHNQPVQAFGSNEARLLIVGLAPGLHGANATGRPFTGDASGNLLFRYLHKYGFASQDHSRSLVDGTRLIGCRITNAVKCLPPKNRPIAREINTCNQFLSDEIKTLPPHSVLLALGTIAHRATLMALALRQSRYRFCHLAEYDLPSGIKLIDSFHCSQYMINTGKLTAAMFDAVLARIRQVLG